MTRSRGVHATHPHPATDAARKQCLKDQRVRENAIRTQVRAVMVLYVNEVIGLDELLSLLHEVRRGIRMAS